MKPKVIVTRSIGWEKFGSKKLDITCVPIYGKSRIDGHNRQVIDGHYTAATATGIDDVVKTIKRIKPQVLLRWVNPKVSAKTLSAIRDASPKTIIFCADGNNPDRVSDYFKKYSDLIDVPLINSRDPGLYVEYRKAGFKHVDTLYEACNPAKSISKNTRYDCFFGGSNRRRVAGHAASGRRMWKWEFPGGEFRWEFIRAVASKYRLLLLGVQNQWPGLVVRNVVRGSEYLDSFRLADTVLGCNQYDIIRYYTRRMFHAGSSGRLLITKYIPGMEKDFEDGKNIVWFKTVSEGLYKIGMYRTRKVEREKIAAAGLKLFGERHSWRARLRDFEKIVARVL